MEGTRQLPQFNVRMSKELIDHIKEQAKANHRSINSEIVVRLEASRNNELKEQKHD